MRAVMGPAGAAGSGIGGQSGVNRKVLGSDGASEGKAERGPGDAGQWRKGQF